MPGSGVNGWYRDERPGRWLATPPPVRRLRWVASPPPGTEIVPLQRLRRPYAGPPSYPAPPRWGFPNLTWRRPTMVPGTPSAAEDPVVRQRTVAGRVLATLAAAAMLAVMSGAAELWRYLLLVQSRTSSLDSGVVLYSDALVVATALLTFVMGALALGLTLWWLLLARDAVAENTGVAPARETRRVLLAVFVPGPNLILAGEVLAELEHAALGRAPGQRPRPSRLVLGWWAAWVINAVLVVATVVWRTREGVQAQADSVLLTACTDLAAGVLAALTAVVVHRIARLLSPAVATGRRLRVLTVRGAPEPPLRTTRPAGSRR